MSWQGLRELEREIKKLREEYEWLRWMRRVLDGEDEGLNPPSRSKSPSQSSAPTAVKEDASNNPACSLCGSRVDRLVFDKGRFFCFPCLERFKERSRVSKSA